MIQFLIIAEVVAAKAAQAEAQRRRALGMPPLPVKDLPPSKWDTADTMMVVCFLLSGIVFCAPWILMIYAAMKIAFKVQGVPFP